MELVVGDKKCGYLEICRILLASKSSEPLLDKLVPLARALQVPVDFIRKLKLNEKLSLESSDESLHQILENWGSSQSHKAKLSVLIAELEKLQLATCAEDLRNHFKIQQTRDAFYICPPNGYDDFMALKVRVLIISSMDKNVTASKLTDTTNCVHLQDNTEFARRLATGKSEECFSIACNDEFQLLDVHPLIVSIPKPKVILITEDTLENAQSVSSKLEHVTAARDTLKWSHLTPLGQVSLSKTSIFISGKLMAFKEVAHRRTIVGILDDIVDEKLLLDLVNDKTPNLVASGIPDPIEYYVPRRISPRNLLKKDQIFNNDNDNEDVFIFKGMERPELSRLAYPHSTDTSSNQSRLPHPNVAYILLEMKSDFESISKKANTSLHWIDFRDGKFYWIKSSGKLDTIHQILEEEEEQMEYSEAEFLNDFQEKADNELPVIISDTPGMGKSQLLANFGRELETRGEIVLFGDMYDVVKGHKTLQSSGMGMTDALIQQLSILGGSNPLAQAFLCHALKSGERGIRINVMLDGLDEVLASDMELALQILKDIKSITATRLWVATRPQLLNELENCLNSLGHTLREFNSGDQVECLVKFWKETYTCQSRLEIFANHCLKTLATSAKSEIAGVPLQCMLIGDIFKEEAKNFANPDNLTTEQVPTIQIQSITQLFQIMIEQKFKKFFERYKRLSNKASTNFYKKDLTQAHIFYSLRLLFPEFKILKENSRLQMKDIQNVGILKFVSADGVPHFIHRLFAEFFVALFLKRIFSGDKCQGEIDDADKFMSAVFTTNAHEERLERFTVSTIKTYKFEQKMILYFVDQLIQPSAFNFCVKVNSKQLAHSCINDQLTNLFDCFEKMKLFAGHQESSLFDSDLLNLAAIHSGIDLISRICEKYEKASGLRVRDILLNGKTLLHIVVVHRAFSVVEHFIIRQGFGEILENNRKLICDLVLECVGYSQYDSDQLIREKCDTLNLLTHFNNGCLGDLLGDKNPLLKSRVHLKLLCQLIRLGVDVMDLDYKQMSILHVHALSLEAEHYHELVTHIPTNSISKLLQLREKDGGFTPLHYLVCFRDPDPRTLQLFQQLGADFNSFNYDQDSVLETAVKEHRSIAILDLLILHGADWRPNEPNDWTILHVALGSWNIEAFKYFGDKMTDDNTTLRQCISNIVHWDDLEKPEFFSETGMNLNAKDKLGQTLLQRILQNYKASDPLQLISLLERHGAVSTAPLAFEALVYISTQMKQKNVSKEWDPLARSILNKWPAVLEERDGEGNTLLHHAVSTSSQPFFDDVISKTVDTNLKNLFGETPLHLVVEAKTAKTLVKHGADLTTLDHNYLTPLRRAIQRDDTPVITCLLAYWKADDNSHHPILDYLLFASKFGNFATFRVCFDYHERGENSNVVERDNLSMLRASVRNEDARIFEHLLNKVDDKDLDQIVHEIVSSIKIKPTKRNESIVDGKIKMLELVKARNVALINSEDTNGRIPLLLEKVHVDVRIWLMRNIAEPTTVDHEGRNVLFYGGTQYQYPKQLQKFLEYFIISDSRQQFRAQGSTLLLEISRRMNHKFKPTHEILELFRDNGADFNVVDENGMSLLMHAVKSGQDARLLTKLVEMGCDLTMTNKQQSGILHLAAEYGDIEAVELFVTKCDVNSTNINLDTPLHIAIESERKSEIALILISEGADINAENKDGLSARNHDISNYIGLLHHAAGILDSNAIQVLIAKGWDVNARNKYGDMPIHYAARSRNLPICKNWLGCVNLLVEKGANLYAKDHERRNILHVAASEQSDKHFRKLLDYVIEKSEEQLIRKRDMNKCTVLHLAVGSRRISSDTLDLLLKYNDINDTDIHGNSVLSYWIEKSFEVESGLNLGTFKFLLEKGADINSKNNLGQSLLHYFFMTFDKLTNWKQVFDLLIHYGANLFDKDNDGRNLVHLAAVSGNHNKAFQALLSLIIERGLEELLKEKDGNGGSMLHNSACYLELNEELLSQLLCFNDINEIDNDGDSVLCYAIQGQSTSQTLESLIIKGAEWKHGTNKRGDTVLHFAATWGAVEALKFFIEKGCVINAVNNLGETPLHCALRGERFLQLHDIWFIHSVHYVVEVLMKANPDVNVVDQLGHTPIVLAKEKLEQRKLARRTVDLLSGT